MKQKNTKTLENLRKLYNLVNSKDFKKLIEQKTDEKELTLAQRVLEFGRSKTNEFLFRLFVTYPVKWAIKDPYSDEILIYCDSSVQAYIVHEELQKHGYDVDIIKYQVFTRPF